MNYRRKLSGFLAGALLLGASTALAAAPTVTVFQVPANGFSPLPITAFTATDSDGTVNGYMITTTSTKPLASNPNWLPTPPTTWTTTTVGSLTLYAWARDNSNTVSNSRSASTTVLAAHKHNYGQVVVVAQSGGDFTDLESAVASISDASAQKPYLIKVMPGVYDLGTLSIGPYTDIEGSGRNVTRFTNAGLWFNSGESEVRHLKIDGSRPVTAMGGGKLTLTDVDINCDGLQAVEQAISLGDKEIAVKDSCIQAQAVLTSNGYGISIDNSTFIVQDGGAGIGITVADGSRAILRNVTVDASAVGGGVALATVGYGGSSAKVFQGTYFGDISGNVQIAGAQVVGTVDATVTLVNCFDGAFAPLNP